MFQKSFILPLLVSALFFSCIENEQQTTEITPVEPLVNPAETVKKIDAEASKISLEKGAIVGMGDLLAVDVIYIPEGHRPIHGKQNLLNAMQEAWADEYNLGWKPVHAEASQAGDMVVVYGEWELSHIADPTHTPVTFGNYLDVYKKDENGDWKIHLGMGNHFDPFKQVEMYELLKKKKYTKPKE